VRSIPRLGARDRLALPAPDMQALPAGIGLPPQTESEGREMRTWTAWYERPPEVEWFITLGDWRIT
jgi:hypothetical protein